MSTLILALVLNAISHYKKIGNNEFIHYPSENLTSFVVIVFVVLFEYFITRSLIHCAGLIVLAPSVRWIVHDLMLNWLRGLEWDYLGTRSRLDRFLRAFRNKIGLHYILVKAIALGVSAGAYLFIVRGM